MLHAIVNHLWQSTLIALLIMAVMPLFRGNGANVRHALWLVASLKFLIPFSLLMALGRWLAPAAPAFAPHEIYAVVVRLAQPLPETADMTIWPYVLAGLWAMGALIITGRWTLRALALGAQVRASRLAPLRVQTSVPGLPVRYTKAPLEPGIVGIVRPVLLLPEGIDGRLTPAQMRAVFGHEAEHWRRKDNLTAFLHMLVEALFWFHPLVWWIGARLVEERERACDEAVVAAGHAPESYAEGILNVCHFYVASRLACAPGVSGADLKARITAIMENSKMIKLAPHKKLLIGLAAALVLATPVLAGMATGVSAADAKESSVNAAKPTKTVPPVYPKDAAKKGIEGVVTLGFTIGKDGKPRDIKVTQSEIMTRTLEAHGDQLKVDGKDFDRHLFEKPSIDALKQFEFAPVKKNGKAVEVKNQVYKFSFKLGGHAGPAASAPAFAFTRPVGTNFRLAWNFQGSPFADCYDDKGEPKAKDMDACLKKAEKTARAHAEELKQQMDQAKEQIQQASKAMAQARGQMAQMEQQMAMLRQQKNVIYRYNYGPAGHPSREQLENALKGLDRARENLQKQLDSLPGEIEAAPKK